MPKPLILRADAPVQLISMHALTRPEGVANPEDAPAHEGVIDEVIYVSAKGTSFSDPLEILERKILHLSRILDCSEEEATRIFLHTL